ncbi:MAG: hypothetical protein R2712_01510 [Vicinamibacterales bacterium]
MKFKYSKYVPNPLDELDMDELMSKLSDLLLSSGFDNPWDPSGGMDRTMQALHDAILEALFSGGVLLTTWSSSCSAIRQRAARRRSGSGSSS